MFTNVETSIGTPFVTASNSYSCFGIGVGDGVAAGVREDEENRYVVFQNYGDQATVKLTESYKDLQTDACIGGTLMLEKNQIAVLYRRK